jgi:hypothetical protein
MEGGEQSGSRMDFGSLVLRKPTPSRPQPGSSSSDSLTLWTGYGGRETTAGSGGGHESDRSYSHMLAGSMSSAVQGEDGREDGMGLGSRSLRSGGGSFAERLAARGNLNYKDMESGGIAGSGPPTSHQPKSVPPSQISMPQASYQLTIPPGLSPTQLLGSPVFLTTSQVGMGGDLIVPVKL